MEFRNRLFVLSFLCFSFGSAAKVFNTVPKVLTETYGSVEAAIQKQFFVSGKQKKKIESLMGKEWEGSGIVTYYQTSSTKKDEGKVRCYLHQHRVRTLSETVMVVIDKNHRVKKIEILKFEEPQEYMVSPKWSQQFYDKNLQVDRPMKSQNIQNITGATLSSNALKDAVREVIAIDQVLSEK